MVEALAARNRFDDHYHDCCVNGDGGIDRRVDDYDDNGRRVDQYLRT
ncbi:MAG: hypothetical protein RLZZ538_385, partial [Actinomycetota bacterium]